MNLRKGAGVIVVFGTLVTAVLAARAQSPTPGQPAPPPRTQATPARDQQAPVKGTGVLKGFVVDARTGAPVRGALVRASSSDARANVPALSDPEGRFEIKDLPTGKYSLTASRTGFLMTIYGQRRTQGPGTPVQVVDGQIVEKVTIAMSRGGVIAGRVFDEFGEPVAAAEVRALQHRFEGGGRRLLPSYGSGGVPVRTDDLGAFRLYGLQPGQYYVSAHLNVFQASVPANLAEPTGPTTTFFPNSADPAGAQRLIVAAGRETGPIALTLVSTRMARIRGRAVTSNGEPFTPAYVNLTLRDSTGAFGGGGSSVRPDGSFEIPRVAVGTYQLIVQPQQGRSDDDQEIGRAVVAVAGEDVDDVLIVGAKPGIARGRIVTDDGTPLPLKPSEINVNAAPVSFDDQFNSYNPGKVAADYSFEIRGLHGTRLLRFGFQSSNPDGWIVKAVTWNGDDVSDSGIEFHPNRVVDGIEIVLTRRATELSGVVTNDRGEPSSEAWLVIFPADESRWTWQTRFVRATRPGQDGKYRFRGLPPHSGYLIAAVVDMEQGQWQDPDFLRGLQERATRVSLAEGETKVHNLRVARAAQ